MVRMLRLLGITLLGATVWLVLGGAIGWIPESRADALGSKGAALGLVLLAASVLACAFLSAGQLVRRRRCARCGARVERGQAYCLDHLRATVDEFRDQASRETPSSRRKSA